MFTIDAMDNEISIHPPQAGWDRAETTSQATLARISIHPPQAGWDDHKKRLNGA